MAENLARIYGTEEDKVNCPFYFKIGACRHGDRCSRTHHRPLFSQTLLIQHMYTLPPVHPQTGMPTVNEKDHLIDFAEEVIDELQVRPRETLQPTLRVDLNAASCSLRSLFSSLSLPLRTTVPSRSSTLSATSVSTC